MVAALIVGGMLLWPAVSEITVPGGGGIKRRDRGARQKTTAIINDEPGIRRGGDDVATARALAAQELLDAILEPGDGPLVGVDFRLYIWDDDNEVLVPAFDESNEPLIRWSPGTGATGTAWQTESYVVARGEEASNAVFGLSPDQQAYFADLQVVAAMPVRNAADRVIAVLTGASTDAESALASEDGFEQHIVAAELCARVLVDLLKWFEDR